MRWAGRLAGTAVAVAAATGLLVGTVHSIRATAEQAGTHQVTLAQLGDAYYACLATQAHSLVRPGQVVVVSDADPGNWATLAKAVAPWAVLTRDPGSAVAVLSLAPDHGPGACLGSVVTARYRDGAVVQGSGATLPGNGPPPPPVL